MVEAQAANARERQPEVEQIGGSCRAYLLNKHLHLYVIEIRVEYMFSRFFYIHILVYFGITYFRVFLEYLFARILVDTLRAKCIFHFSVFNCQNPPQHT